MPEENMRTLYSSVFAVVAAIASTGAWAQSDPKITSFVTPELSPNEVTLSRGTGATAFVGQAAYRVAITMNAANVLNKALFTATTSVVEASPSDTVVPGQTAAFDDFDGLIPGAAIGISGEGLNPNCTISGDKKSLSCNFGDGQLVNGDTAVFIILVRAPEKGGRIKLDWSFGGDEGKGNGNGCCTNVQRLYTKLIDASDANSTVKTHAQTFVVKGAITTLFTGVKKGADKDDPWTTIADLGANFTVAGGKTYVQGLIDEKKNSVVFPAYNSCSALNKNECWQSQLTVDQTTWLPGDPLWITVERHSSIIKNGTKLTDYTNGFEYSKDGVTFAPIPLCADVGGLSTAPDGVKHCLAPRGDNLTACVERSLGQGQFVWSCSIKALENGYIRR
jgi:hypothetical protein